jgi:hypothetical protein
MLAQPGLDPIGCPPSPGSPIVVLVCMVVRWRLNPRFYADIDGPYTRWNYRYAFEWGNWFDLSAA